MSDTTEPNKRVIWGWPWTTTAPPTASVVVATSTASTHRDTTKLSFHCRLSVRTTWVKNHTKAAQVDHTGLQQDDQVEIWPARSTVSRVIAAKIVTETRRATTCELYFCYRRCLDLDSVVVDVNIGSVPDIVVGSFTCVNEALGALRLIATKQSVLRAFCYRPRLLLMLLLYYCCCCCCCCCFCYYY